MSQDLEERITSLERQKRLWQLLALAGWALVLVVGTVLLVSRQAGLAREQAARAVAEQARQEALQQRDQAEKARRDAEEAAKKARERSELHLYSEQIRLAQRTRERQGGPSVKP